MYGRISQVQEQRFRLVLEDDGPSYVLTLAHDAPIEATDLHAYMHRRARVEVEYEGEPGLASGVAHVVRAA